MWTTLCIVCLYASSFAAEQTVERAGRQQAGGQAERTGDNT